MNSIVNINMKDRFGSFLSNGSLAAVLSVDELSPNIQAGKTVVLDMSGIENMTDSFGNALIANTIKTNGEAFFKYIKFSNCSDTMKVLIEIAVKFGRILEYEDKQNKLMCV